MRPRSERKKSQKKKSNTPWIVLAMLLALAIGFFSAPFLINKVSQIEEGFLAQPFFQNLIENFEESYFGQGLSSFWQNRKSGSENGLIDDPKDPGVDEPPSQIEPPDEPGILPTDEEDKILLDFPQMEVWLLQLAFSQDLDWAVQYRESLESELPIHIEEKNSGAILFLGPYPNSLAAQEDLEEAESIGFDEAYPAAWNWPEARLNYEASNQDDLVKAKTTAAFLNIVSLFWQENIDLNILAEELQILNSTNFAFNNLEDQIEWNHRLEILQELFVEPSNESLKAEIISLVFNDRIFYQALDIIS